MVSKLKGEVRIKISLQNEKGGGNFSFIKWFFCILMFSFVVGLEFGELHLCPDSSPSSRERGRSGGHKGQDILRSSGQYG